MVNPTGYTALDFIGFTDKGTYAANVNYVKNDLVHHGGNIWRVLVDDTIGITPAEGTSYTLFIGEPTNLVERIIAPLEENPATIAYGVGRQIIYNNYLYEVIKNIAVGDILVAYEDDPTNANIKLASPVETQVLALNESKVNKSDVVNNVTTTTAGKVLDARQGKALQDGINAKVNKSDIANNVTTTAEGKVLDARQGKALQDGINAKVNKSDIANNVTTTAKGKVLDARQGKALQDSKTDNSVIAPVESGTTASRAYAIGAHFIKDGAFCTAKTAIAQGEAFTLNTNYTAGNIGDRVEDLEEAAVKRVLFFGDSYCDGNRGGYTRGVYTKFLAMSGLYDNTNSKLYALGGAGFVGAGQGKTFGDLLNDAITDGHFTPSQVTDIIIAGGCNDQSYEQSAINVAKDNFFTLAHNTYPNARIWIACIGGFVDATSRKNLITKVNLIYNFTPRPYVFPIYNAMSAMQFMDSFDTDGIHPKSTGVDRISELLATAFKAGSNYGKFGADQIVNVALLTVSGEVNTAPTFEVDSKERFVTIQMKIGTNFSPTNSIGFAYNTGTLFKIGSVNTTKMFICPNVTASNAESFRTIQAEMYAYKNTVTEWVLLSGEIIIVKTSNTTADVFFKTRTCCENGNTSTFRCGYLKAVLAN